ncbi:hypothetical protein Pint_05727 [Pistacia integerrima]|uniref:Uncharacterized protein n=1 Tax=Pistacia integerrima TaxID=434235 RepID=A0ACC0Z3I7_9ROSI|nr:hypothetical protein Pint_05727 [Pistacia integerrima]
MQPHFNSFPHQIQSNSSTPQLPHQGFNSNMLQNSMPLQPQMGILNPQFPFNLGNGQAMPMPNMQAPLMTQPNFMNAQNPFVFSQNNHLGMPQLPPMSQPQHNLNNVPMFPGTGQMFGSNLSNLPQHLSQNMALQNLNQLVSMQMANPAFLGNPQFGLVHSNGVGQNVNQNRQNLVQPVVDANGSIPSPSSRTQQNQNLQPSVFARSQGNSIRNGQGNASNNNWKNGSGKNFVRNPKREHSRGFQKSQFHHGDDAKRKYGFHNNHKAKGHRNEMTAKFGQANHLNQPKEKKRKSLALTYTEKEIQQWCEERRKNYPTKANIEKRLSAKQLSSDIIDREAKIRREQLKDILAKQAELGVEVAEVPSHYLFDSDKPVNGREEYTKPFNKRGRFQNKYDKRGRYNKKDLFAKKQKIADKDSPNTSTFNKKKPTLLQMLLSADIRKDKNHLLQVFRFMVMNSFFKDWPEKPFKFPLVIVKEGGPADEVVEEKSLLVDNDVSEHSSRTAAENFEYGNNDNDGNKERQNQNVQAFDDDECEDDDENNNDEQMGYHVKGKGIIAEEQARPEEEEGEIID